MRMVRARLTLVALMATAVLPTALHGFDASGCLSALEKLQRESRDSVDSAQQAESECSDCEDCRDGDRGDCSSECRSCQSAQESVQLGLRGVESRLRSIEVSCGYRFELDPKKGLAKMQRQLEQKAP